jgi:ankyrin repeat protein
VQITTDALQWEPRRQLATSYLEGANDPDNPSRGLDAFNLAAFYSLGFGVSLDEDLAVTWLKRASSYGHAPATVLCRAYAAAGLFHGFQYEDTAEDGGFWGRLRCQVLPLDSEKRFAIQLRGFYKHQNRRSAQSPISILSAQRTTRVEDEQQLLTFLDNCHNEAIQEAWVTVEMDGQSITKPLMHYLVAAHPELAESMLQRGVDGSDIMEGKRLSLLHTACASGSKRLILLLLDTFPELAMVITSDGVSPLHWLFMLEDNEMLEVAQALAKSTAPGIGAQQVGVGVFAEFNLIFSGPPVHWAIMARNATAVECLLRCGVDPNYESPMPQAECLRYSGFPLDVAVCMLMPELVELLIRHGAKLGLREDEVRMAIHFIGDAVDPFRLWLYHGSQVREAVKATVNTLLRHGVELDAESDDGRTPLRYITTSPACTVLFLEPFLSFGPACPQDLLLWAAQSLEHDQVNGRKMALALDFCSRNQGEDLFMDQCLRALEFLVRDGSVSAAREVFRYFDQSRLPNVIDEKEYLHIAAAANHAEMMELLLELGATLDRDAGGTAAAAAACRSSRKALDYLLRQGASVFTSPSSPESATILHEIVSEGQSLHESERTLEHVCGNDEHLLHLNAIVNNYDSRGFTALHVAITWGSLVNAARLLEMGADERCVRGTDISPTTLALLAKSHTPWLITRQGPAEVLRHQKRMDEIITFLTQSSGFGLPSVVAGYERVVGHWTKNTRQFEIKIIEGGSSIEWCRSGIGRS